MRILALDVGEKRIGLAISDETELLAQPLGVLHRKSKADDFRQIASLARERQTHLVVVGLPLKRDGSLSAQALRIKRYALSLAEATGLSLQFFDESYSTIHADSILTEIGRKNKTPIDAAAAAVILQTYLEDRRSKREADQCLKTNEEQVNWQNSSAD
jgi:putative holliday junction resolvase